MKKLIYIVGPTASGKTDLALKLSKKISGEIIGADSMQIYKYIEVGTAKPTKEEIGNQKYHLIDFVDPQDIYTAYEFKNDALDIIKKTNNPIICGGTGLYVNSIIYNMEFTNGSFDLEYRKSLEKKSKDVLLDMLKQVDFETYQNIDKDNIRRVVRALEIFHLSKDKKSNQIYDYKKNPREFDHRVFILDMPREILYNRINTRVDIMIENGLIDEVEFLLSKYKDFTKPIFQFIGYKEIVSYINGKVDKDKAIEEIKKNTRHFAKRQMTWFRGLSGIDNIEYINPLEKNVFETILNKIEVNNE